jgi:hypothetical protein
MGTILGLFLVALLGTALAGIIWLRLLVWQRFTSLLLQTTLTHTAVMGLVALVSGLNFWDLMAWGGAIFVACYVAYCAYLSQVRISNLIMLAPLSATGANKSGLAVEFLLLFLEYTVYRAVYSRTDVAGTLKRR